MVGPTGSSCILPWWAGSAMQNIRTRDATLTVNTVVVHCDPKVLLPRTSPGSLSLGDARVWTSWGAPPGEKFVGRETLPRHRLWQSEEMLVPGVKAFPPLRTGLADGLRGTRRARASPMSRRDDAGPISM